MGAAELIITGEGRWMTSRCTAKWSARWRPGCGRGAARPATSGLEHIPVLVMAGQVTPDESALRDAGVAAA